MRLSEERMGQIALLLLKRTWNERLKRNEVPPVADMQGEWEKSAEEMGIPKEEMTTFHVVVFGELCAEAIATYTNSQK